MDIKEALQTALALIIKESDGSRRWNTFEGYVETALCYYQCVETVPEPPPPTPDKKGIWIGKDEILALPQSGKAWENVLGATLQDISSPNLSDQNDKTDTYVLANALVHIATGLPSYKEKAETALKAVMGTEAGAGILAIVRNITSYVLSADIIGYDDPDFKAWLDKLRYQVFSGAGPSLSVISCHYQRPNNFGTHAGAARIAIALYLDDRADLEKAANVFKGWLGDRIAYSGFKFGKLDWQANPNEPVGINPVGATKDGHSIDGVLPDDQRRAGGFVWPPPREGYVWEGLQSAVVQAELLSRAGYASWQWSDYALFRAMKWLYEEANYPAEGDDNWIPWLVNSAYNINEFPAVSPTSPGKSMGWTDWTHGG